MIQDSKKCAEVYGESTDANNTELDEDIED